MKKKEEKNNVKNDYKELSDIIVAKAVEEYKAGSFKSSMDVEGFLDSLLQPLMQKLLDAELDSHLEYSKYERKDNGNYRNGHCKAKNVQTKYGTISIGGGDKTPFFIF